MSENRPMPCELKQGTHFLCACGKTGNAPYCDGSHSGSGITPKQHEAKADNERIFWCQCGTSGDRPYCDGSHAKLSG